MSSSSFSRLHGRLTGLLGRRDLTTIPKDQQQLLDSQESWAVNLKDSPHGLANVPGHVLQTTKEAHLAKQGRITKAIVKDYLSENDQSEGSGSASNSDTPSPKLLHDAAVETGKVKSTVEPTRVSSPERDISWSPSPGRPSSEAGPGTMQSSIVRETPKVLITRSALFAARGALKEPPPQAVPAMSLTPLDNDEEEMEMELPQAQEKLEAPVNRRASLVQRSPFRQPSSLATTNTPPCAQPRQSTYSSTMLDPQSSPQRDVPLPMNRPFKRHKPHNLDTMDTEPHGQPKSSSRKESSKASVEVACSNSNSNSTSNSLSTQSAITYTPLQSMIPATIPDSPIRALGTSPMPQPAVRPGHSSQQQNAQPPSPDQTGPYNFGMHPEQPKSSMVPLSLPVDPSHGGVADPFALFCKVYPQYTTQHNGDVQSFVLACVCLDYLRKENDLRECLYDDFIRAFASGYLEYARRAESQEVLPAISWFNNLNGPCLFNSFIVTRDYLPQILSSYPEEVARARDMTDNADELPKVEKPQIGQESAHRKSSERTDKAIEVSKKASNEVRPDSEPDAQSASRPLSHLPEKGTADAQAIRENETRQKRVHEEVSRLQNAAPATSSPSSGHFRGKDSGGKFPDTSKVLTQPPPPQSPELGIQSPDEPSTLATPAVLSRPLAQSRPAKAAISSYQLSSKKRLHGDGIAEGRTGGSPAVPSSSAGTTRKVSRLSRYFSGPSLERPSSSALTTEEKEKLKESFKRRKSDRAASVGSSRLSSG